MKSIRSLLTVAACLLCLPALSPAQTPTTKPADSKEPVRWPSRPRMVIWSTPGAEEKPKHGKPSDLLALTQEKDAVAAHGFDLIAVHADGLVQSGHPDDEIRRLQMACKAMPGKVLLGTLPIGTDGWEANQNRPRMELAVGKAAVDDVAQITRQRHFGNLAQVDAAGYALVFAHLNRDSKALKPDALAFYADSFLALCKEKNKRCYLWFSADFLRDENGTALVRRVIESTKGRVEAYVWMDVPKVVAAGQIPLDDLLRKITELTPADKTIIQYRHDKKLKTETPAKVLDFAEACRQQKIDAFAVETPWAQLKLKKWAEFYKF